MAEEDEKSRREMAEQRKRHDEQRQLNEDIRRHETERKRQAEQNSEIKKGIRHY